MAVNIAVIGAKGKLGQNICQWSKEIANVKSIVEIEKNTPIEQLNSDEIDLAIEVTNAHHVLANTKRLLAKSIPTIVGASGIHADQYPELDLLAKENQVPCWIIPNFSICAVLMMQIASRLATHFNDCHIIESHHKQKVDKPSGTAAHTASLVEKVSQVKPEIFSLRHDGVIADQSVIFSHLGESLTIQHHTQSRDSFKKGVIIAINHTSSLANGLTIGLENLLSL